MPGAERPGGHGHAEAHTELRVSEVMRHHGQHVDAPAEAVDREHDQGDQGESSPFPAAQGMKKPAHTGQSFHRGWLAVRAPRGDRTSPEPERDSSGYPLRDSAGLTPAS